jgi:hypothetical protein
MWFVLAVESRAADEPRWIHISSPSFEVYSSAGAGATRDVLQNLEFVRAFFSQMSSALPNHERPVHIVLFASRKEHDRYRSVAWESAAYHQGLGHDTIVMGDASADSSSTAVHEYFHLWAKRERLKLPVWLNEGMAQLYSTIKPTLGGQVVGEMPAGFGTYLSHRGGWMPLQNVVGAREYPQSAEVNDFYLEAWALTHMLELSPDYRPGAARLMSTLQSGSTSEEALMKVYGKPLSAIETDLMAYLWQIGSRKEVYRGKLAKAPKASTVEPAAEFERRLVLVRLLPWKTRADEIRRELKALAEVDPKRPEPHEELGELAALMHDDAAAQRELELAFDLGSEAPDLLWAYGKMLQDNPSRAVKVFERLLRVEPTREDARTALARAQAAARGSEK